MLYVNDEELGRVDICKLQTNDIEYIVRLLRNEAEDTDNLNTRDRAIRLAAELSPDADYEMAWADVFLIAELLMFEAYGTDDMEIKRQADRLLVDFEAATKQITASSE